MRTEDLVDLAVPEDPALSPDQTQVVYVLRTTDVAEDRTVRNLWRVPRFGGHASQLTFGGSDVCPRWSPSGGQLAFLRQTDGIAQLWLWSADGGEPHQVTSLSSGAGTPCWSPDGSRIAFSAPVDIASDPRADQSTEERGGNSPIVADRLDYIVDGAGYLGTVRSHVHVVDLDSGNCRQVTDGDWHAGEPAWSPDGTTLAFSAAIEEDSDLSLRRPAYTIGVDGGDGRPRLAGFGAGYAGPVTWTADGDGLLVVGYDGVPAGHASLFQLPLDGSDFSNLTAQLDRNVLPGAPAYPGALPALIDGGRSVAFCVRDRGCSHLYRAPVNAGAAEALLDGSGRSVSGMSAQGDVAAVVLGTPMSFGEIVTIDLNSGLETVLTNHGSAVSDVTLYPRVERKFTVHDGTVVQGWLMRDPEASGPGPLLLDVHGGPHNAWNSAADDVHLYHQELVARGWTVLLLNPRGSDGYGEAFYRAMSGQWGVADARDLLDPVDELVDEGTADPARLAVTGYSYGGFMTCYLTSRDDRFAAAVAGGLISDLTSMAGTSDGGHYLGEYEFGGRPWVESSRYQSMSPFSQVDRVVTPTLVLQGAADLRCPTGQASQWYSALRERGVPARLVLYPNSSHLFVVNGLPSHRIDYGRRVVDWVEQYAGEPGGTQRPPIDISHWQRRLDTLAARHKVPGAVLGVLRLRSGRDDETMSVAHGVLNRETEVETTTDSLFQLGSITKVWTATAVMRLVDDGLLDLDAPIVDVLPEFQLADHATAQTVTMRHLLTHTSGIDGDVLFPEAGRGDDCLEKYVACLSSVRQNHPLGATWSYCNSCYSVIGRVIEKITERTWDEAMRELLFDPLQHERTVTLPEDALLHRAAVGHVSEGGGDPFRAGVWTLPRSWGPAGLITASVDDVLSFARLHLTNGTGPDGKSLLSATSVAAMADKQADIPDVHSTGDSWGLGWIRYGWDGHRLIGHDGGTIGQGAMLRILPDAGIAVALLTNGGNLTDLYEDLFREVFAELADVKMPKALAALEDSPQVDISRHVGIYERPTVKIEVMEGDENPVFRITFSGQVAESLPDPVREYALRPADLSGDLFVIREPGSRTGIPVTFYAMETGEQYVHFGSRATPKVS